VFLKICIDREERHNKEIISTFNQQVFVRHSCLLICSMKEDIFI